MSNTCTTSTDICIELGVRYLETYTYTDSAGVPIDMTGGALEGEIKASATQGAALILDLTPYLSITDAVAGEARLLLPASVTTALGNDHASYNWAYSIRYTPSGGDAEPWTTGAALGVRTTACD